MNMEVLAREIEQKLVRRVNADPKLHNVYMLVHSDRLNIHFPIAAGTTDHVAANPSQPFHTASVGKMFTSVIIAKLIEQGRANLEDPIEQYLPTALLKNLHIYKGKEYTSHIQIKHLLSHTSGLPDFFEDKPRRQRAFMQEVIDQPSRLWTPEETVQWSKEHLTPHFPPGKGIHYTDTGYNLLGLMIESITGKRYAEVLRECIFEPLHMNHSYLSHYSEPAVKNEYPIANLFMDDIKINVNEYRSFSSFFAGGQTVSTLEDMLIFMKSLVQHQLIKQESLDRMQSWTKMWVGMKYGHGLMRLQFIPFTQKYVAWGHLGASGAFALYLPKLDVYLIGSFNQTTYRSKSMNYLFFNVIRNLSKIIV